MCKGNVTELAFIETVKKSGGEVVFDEKRRHLQDEDLKKINGPLYIYYLTSVTTITGRRHRFNFSHNDAQRIKNKIRKAFDTKEDEKFRLLFDGKELSDKQLDDPDFRELLLNKTIHIIFQFHSEPKERNNCIIS
ncbi:MAG: hypothetical protein WCT20_04245 [Candidatus Babeliales bacterium]